MLTNNVVNEDWKAIRRTLYGTHNKTIIFDGNTCPTIDTMSKQDMIEVAQHLRAKAQQTNDTRSPFYSISDEELTKRIDAIFEARKR